MVPPEPPTTVVVSEVVPVGTKYVVKEFAAYVTVYVAALAG
jgi:hypothetical protein